MLCAGTGSGRGVRQNDIVVFGRSALSERPLQSCGFSARALSARTANVILADTFSAGSAGLQAISPERYLSGVASQG